MAKNIKIFWWLTVMKLKRMMIFRSNVVIQATSMVVNNAAFFIMWALLLKRFGNINGYGLKEILLIQGYVQMLYGIFYMFFGGILKLSEYLNQDKFLDLQLFPANPLIVLLTKSASPGQFGDMAEGALFLVVYSLLTPGVVGWIVLGMVLTVGGMVGVSLLFNSLLFFAPKVQNGLETFIDNIFIGASMYPSENFKGGLRLFLTLILFIPVVSFPIEMIRGFFSPTVLVWSILAVVGSNLAGFWLWQKGVKRVESGSSGSITT